MKIKNFDALAVTDLRRAALSIAEAGLEAIDTARILRNTVKLDGNNLYLAHEQYHLPDLGRLFVIGVGKCSLEAAAVLENILGSHLTGGVVVDIKDGGYLKKIKYFKGTHPLPSEKNIKATKEIIHLLSRLYENDLVIFVISGGGSTLLCYPEGLPAGRQSSSSEEEAAIFKSLTKAGATIQEINTVRKHLSFGRGGFLAKYAYPAKGVSLIFSDVLGDDPGFIASGPTVKDRTTVDAAAAILTKYDVFGKCSLESCGLIETPKDKKYFKNIKNMIIASNSSALDAMDGKARELGLRTKICDGCLKGEAREAGLDITQELHKLPRGTALLYGGETTVTIKGSGRGGRNLELVLAAIREIKDDEVILSFASDGRDSGEFAGALCDIITREAIYKSGLKIEEFLQDNNAYPLFEKVGHYLFTGDTGSNVSDLLIAIKS